MDSRFVGLALSVGGQRGHEVVHESAKGAPDAFHQNILVGHVRNANCLLATLWFPTTRMIATPVTSGVCESVGTLANAFVCQLFVDCVVEPVAHIVRPVPQSMLPQLIGSTRPLHGLVSKPDKRGCVVRLAQRFHEFGRERAGVVDVQRSPPEIARWNHCSWAR